MKIAKGFRFILAFSTLVMAFLALTLPVPQPAVAYPRVMLTEYFTNTGCPLCPIWIPPAEAVTRELDPASYIQISYHTWWPQIADPWYYETYWRHFPQDDDIVLRVASYGYDQFMGVPSFFFDGHRIRYHNPMSDFTGEIRTYLTARTQAETPVHIELETEVYGDSLFVHVSAISDEDLSNLTLYTGLCEDYIFLDAASGQSDFYGNFLDMLPDGHGSALRLLANQWERFDYEGVWNIGWCDNDLSNLFIAAWVQHNETHEVLQATRQALDETNPTALVVDAGDMQGLGFELYQIFGQNHIPFADRWIRGEDGQLTAEALSNYRVVFYNTLNAENEFISVAEQQALVRYLDGGGMLVMSGSFLSRELAEGLLFEGYMGVNLDADDTGLTLVRDAGNVGAFEDAFACLGGAGGYARPARTSSFTPRQGAVSLLEYTDQDGNAGGCAAVARNSGRYKTVMLGFPLESMQGLGGTEDQEAMLQRLFTYLTRTQDAPSQAATSPTAFALEFVYPNPFNAETTITYSLPARSPVNLSVFDLSGRLVEVLDQGARVHGVHTVHWNADHQPAGVYLVKLTAGGRTEVRKAVVAR